MVLLCGKIISKFILGVKGQSGFKISGYLRDRFNLILHLEKNFFYLYGVNLILRGVSSLM